MDSRTNRQFFFAVFRTVREHPSQLTRGIFEQFGLTAQFQSGRVACAVPNRVLMVCLARVPSQVSKPTILAYSIFVTRFHSFWTWANKRFKYNRVQRAWASMRVRAKLKQDVTVRPGLVNQNASWASKADVRVASALKSSQRADFITGESRNGTPLFGGQFTSTKEPGSSSRLRSRVRLQRSTSRATIPTVSVKPVRLRAILVKLNNGLQRLAVSTDLFKYSYCSQASSPYPRMSAVRPARMLPHSFGSLSILTQNAGAQS